MEGPDADTQPAPGPPSLRDARELVRLRMTGGEIPSAQVLNNDSLLSKSERHLQPWFRLVVSLCLTLFAFVALRQDQRNEGPDRRPLPPNLATLSYQPVALRQAQAGPFEIIGAWAVKVDDPRFAGLSALALSSSGLLALTDSGALVDLPKPGSRPVARIRDLPAGPGDPTLKKNRDSEALVWDRRRQGWLVTFEYRHGLWFYNRDFTRGALVINLRGLGWRKNKGVEGMVLSSGLPLLLPENGKRVLTVTDRGLATAPLAGVEGEVAEAVRLPDGRILVAVRGIGIGGIRNRLAWLTRGKGGYRLRTAATLPLGLIDNVEGLAAERLPNGQTRVWAVTDNDAWRRTLLLALDLAPSERPLATVSERPRRR